MEYKRAMANVVSDNVLLYVISGRCLSRYLAWIIGASSCLSKIQPIVILNTYKESDIKQYPLFQIVWFAENLYFVT